MKKLMSELKGLTHIERFNTFASLVSISGISIIAVLSNVDLTFNLDRIIAILFVSGAILIFNTILLYFLYIGIEILKKTEIPKVFYILIIIGEFLLALAFVVQSIKTGIEVVSYF